MPNGRTYLLWATYHLFLHSPAPSFCLRSGASSNSTQYLLVLILDSTYLFRYYWQPDQSQPGISRSSTRVGECQIAQESSAFFLSSGPESVICVSGCSRE